MILAQIVDNVVVNVIEVDPENIPEWAAGWPEATDIGVGWVVPAEGQPTPPASPMPTIEDYRVGVQAHIDEVAIAKMYGSGTSCASYVASTNATWAAEAQAFVAWRDEVWAFVYGLMNNPPQEGGTVEEESHFFPQSCGPDVVEAVEWRSRSTESSPSAT